MATMTRTHWQTRVKRQIRSQQLNLPGKVHSVLMLPGPECLDIKQLLNAELIDHDSAGIAVEHFPALSRRIKWRLGRWKLKNWRVFEGELEDLALGPQRPLDFAYIDLCASPTLRLCNWMRHQLSHSLHVGSQLSVTLLRQSRGNRFMQQIRDTAFFQGTTFWSSTQRMLQPLHLEITDVCVTLTALIRLALPTCMLRARYAEPYESDSGAYMFAVRFEVARKLDQAVPKRLMEQFDALEIGGEIL